MRELLNQTTIGVIGAGAASTALLFDLLACVSHARVRIVVIEGAGSLGAGTVYDDDLDCALVNRQAQYMSVLNDDADDFVRWAQANWRPATGGCQTVYYPRSFYRKYLEERFKEACDRWREDVGKPVEMVAARVRSVRQDAKRILLATTHGEMAVDFAILCTGHGLPKAEQYERDTGMLTPYPLREMVRRVNGYGRVAIRGAGLTAIDSALAILESCPATAVDLVSRTGILPDTRADLDEDLELALPPRRSPDGATLVELCRRFHAELDACGVSDADLTQYVARVESGTNTIQTDTPHSSVEARIQSLSVSIANRDLPIHWFGFSRQNRELFHRRYFRLLQAITAPIPQSTAGRLRMAFAEGRLASKKGTLARAGGTWHMLGEQGRYDMVIDGTGTATNASQSAFEAQLVRSGTAMSAKLGGIEVTMNCQVLARTGRPTRLYAIGYATRGSFLYSSSLYQSALQARAVAQDLAARLRLDEGGNVMQPGSLVEVLS
jgi:uncharacterized NAD(P)/FAD-binding protein YdhS